MLYDGNKKLTIYGIDDGVIDGWAPRAKPPGQLTYWFNAFQPRRVTLVFQKNCDPYFSKSATLMFRKLRTLLSETVPLIFGSVILIFGKATLVFGKLSLNWKRDRYCDRYLFPLTAKNQHVTLTARLVIDSDTNP